MIFVIGEPVRLADRSRGRFVKRMAVFVVFALAGAGALASLLSFLGSQVLPAGGSIAWWIGLTSFVVLCVIRETVATGIPIPQRRWQLPRPWLERFWVGAAIFGGAMGAGVFTLTPSALFYVYLFSCFLVANSLTGLIFGLWYGLWFAGAVVYATVRWRGAPAGSDASRALMVLRRARLLGSPLALLLIGAPSIWPFAG